MKYRIERTSKFIKQYEKMLDRKNFNELEFKNVLKHLIDGKKLPIKYRNHLLEPKSKRHMGMSHTTRCIIGV